MICYIDGFKNVKNATYQGPSRLSGSSEKFVRERRVVSSNSWAGSLETNSIINDSSVKWLRVTLSDKNYHG